MQEAAVLGLTSSGNTGIIATSGGNAGVARPGSTGGGTVERR